MAKAADTVVDVDVAVVEFATFATNVMEFYLVGNQIGNSHKNAQALTGWLGHYVGAGWWIGGRSNIEELVLFMLYALCRAYYITEHL